MHFAFSLRHNFMIINNFYSSIIQCLAVKVTWTAWNEINACIELAANVKRELEYEIFKKRQKPIFVCLLFGTIVMHSHRFI